MQRELEAKLILLGKLHVKGLLTLLQGRPLSSPLQKQPFIPQFMVFWILPKNERNSLSQVKDILSQDSEFRIFWRIQENTICLRDLLTFARFLFSKNLALHYVQNVSILISSKNCDAILAQTSVIYLSTYRSILKMNFDIQG